MVIGESNAQVFQGLHSTEVVPAFVSNANDRPHGIHQHPGQSLRGSVAVSVRGGPSQCINPIWQALCRELGKLVLVVDLSGIGQW
ncbi:hypothetical protein D3C72_2215380 [compost metagenome]